MLCNYCLERIPEGEEVRELGSGKFEKGGCYHKECYKKTVEERTQVEEEKENKGEEFERERKQKARANLLL